jgi:branched-subunit amino acid transport protein
VSATVAIVALAVVTFVFKGVGALVPSIPALVERRLGGLAPALLAALVVTELTDDRGVPHLDAKAAGVAAAVVLAWRRAPFAVCVVAGAAVAAGLRVVGVD